MLPVFFQTLKNFLVAQARDVAAQGHNQIDSSQFLLMLPEAFTNQPLDAVAGHCCFYMLARDSHAKPRKRELAILPEYHKIFITGAT